MSEALEDINAAELQFSSEFRFDGDAEVANVQALTNDEVYYLLEDERLKAVSEGRLDSLTDTFKAAHAHLEKVVTTRVFNDVQAIASTLSNTLGDMEFERKHDRKLVKLHPYERTSLINLLKASDTTPEETLHWIPSLVRFDEDQIQKVRSVPLKAHVVDAVARQKSPRPLFQPLPPNPSFPNCPSFRSSTW